MKKATNKYTSPIISPRNMLHIRRHIVHISIFQSFNNAAICNKFSNSNFFISSVLRFFFLRRFNPPEAIEGRNCISARMCDFLNCVSCNNANFNCFTKYCMLRHMNKPKWCTPSTNFPLCNPTHSVLLELITLKNGNCHT